MPSCWKTPSTSRRSPHIKRKADGGDETVMYLEGSDQHRGWFQSSLLECCGTRGRAPFDVVLTHGFVLDENGRKMSKSLGNVTAPQDVIKQSGADILRMWVCAADYADDLRIGPEILKTTVDTYRKLRNTLRWMLGNLAHFDAADRVARRAHAGARAADAASARRARCARAPAYADFDYKRIFAALNAFMTVDLSAFYFDIRKDALYCDPYSSRQAQRLPHRARSSVPLHGHLACADALLHRRGGLAGPRSGGGVGPSGAFPDVPASWRDDALAEKWRKLRESSPRRHRRAGTRARGKAHRLFAGSGADRLCCRSASCSALRPRSILPNSASPRRATLVEGDGPAEAFRLDDVAGVAVEPRRAEGRKCARSWKISPAVGSDPQYPDVTPRDAQALREWDAMRKAAE